MSRKYHSYDTKVNFDMKWGTSSFYIDLEGSWSQIPAKHDITYYTLGLVKLFVKL